MQHLICINADIKQIIIKSVQDPWNICFESTSHFTTLFPTFQPILSNLTRILWLCCILQIFQQMRLSPVSLHNSLFIIQSTSSCIPFQFNPAWKSALVGVSVSLEFIWLNLEMKFNVLSQHLHFLGQSLSTSHCLKYVCLEWNLQ